MKRIVFLVIASFVVMGCSANANSVPEKIEKLNREAAKIVVEKSNRQVTGLFNKTLDVPFYNSVCNYADELRNDAFDRDDFSKLDLFAEKAKPVYRIIVGGDANFISPNVGFFLEKCVPGTVEHRFFELATNGWIDLNGEMHGGNENFPLWIDQIDGISGNFKQGEGMEALKQWKALLPDLKGNYKTVALNTIGYIENMMKGR